MINWNTETNTMNLMNESPTLSVLLAVGAALVVGLMIYFENRKVD